MLLLLTKSVLNYAQAGTSYVPALGTLALGLFLGELARVTPKGRRSGILLIAAGASYAVSVLFWFPFVLVIPGAILAQIVLHERNAAAWKAARIVAATCAVLGLGVALPAGFAVGLRYPNILIWVTAVHDFEATTGLPRAVLGLARSIVDMEDYGRIVKGYMLGDPYNPVTVSAVFHPALLEFVLVYVALLAIVVQLARSTLGRRVLLSSALTSAPVIAFALSWNGGDLERFLPDLSLAGVQCSGRDRRILGAALASGRGDTRPGRRDQPVGARAFATARGGRPHYRASRQSSVGA